MYCPCWERCTSLSEHYSIWLRSVVDGKKAESMPRKTDAMAINDVFIDRRVKLLPCQKEMVLYWREKGLSQRQLAKMFKVSRRLITFVLDPEKQKENLKRRAERGGHKQYYDKDKHAEAIRDHRNYKKKALKGRL